MPELFSQHVLNQHNELRKKHGAKPLKLDDALSKVAQGHAETLGKTERLTHANTHYGENLFTMKSSKPIDDETLAELAVQSWYSEIQKHKFGGEPKDLCTGHFTQVVWLDTTDLGVGHVMTKSGAHYVVCNYNPPGNFLGQFAKKVLPLTN